MSGYPFYVWKGIFNLVRPEIIVQLCPGQGHGGILRVIVTSKPLRLSVRKHKVSLTRNIKEHVVFPSNLHDIRHYPMEILSLLVKHTYKRPTNRTLQSKTLILLSRKAGVYCIYYSYLSSQTKIHIHPLAVQANYSNCTDLSCRIMKCP